MKKAEAIRIRIFLNILCFLLPQTAHAAVSPSSRDRVMEATMYAVEEGVSLASPSQPAQIIKEKEENNFMQEKSETIKWFASDDTYVTFGLNIGYLKGNTAYDFNHHTSELEFPMENVMAGGDLSLGYKDLSLNAQLWAPVEDYSGFNMKDKDWNSQGVLTSYTKSKAYMEAVIWDANLRYDFYKKSVSGQAGTPLLDILRCDAVRVGALLGYKYERFDFEMYDLFYPNLNTTTNQGQKVLGYKIKYWLPYLGLATDIFRENWGFGCNIKYSFYPIARDIDYHFLRDLAFLGDYEKNGQAWMGGINWFWEFIKNWKLRLGADWTFARIDGVTWDDTHNPAWDADQSTDTKQWIYWTKVEYKF